MAWLCSNAKCPDTTKRQQGWSCPTCGSPVLEYRYRKLFSHLSLKGRGKNKTRTAERVESKGEPDSVGEVILSAEMTDEELEEAIREGLHNEFPHHRLSDILDLIESGGEDSGDALVLGALLTHSKILVRQNELILRILRRAFSETPRNGQRGFQAAPKAKEARTEIED